MAEKESNVIEANCVQVKRPALVLLFILFLIVDIITAVIVAKYYYKQGYVHAIVHMVDDGTPELEYTPYMSPEGGIVWEKNEDFRK